MRETESLLNGSINNAIRINYVKANIAKMQQNSKSGLCGDRQNDQSYNKRMRQIRAKRV